MNNTIGYFYQFVLIVHITKYSLIQRNKIYLRIKSISKVGIIYHRQMGQTICYNFDSFIDPGGKVCQIQDDKLPCQNYALSAWVFVLMYNAISFHKPYR